MSEQSISSRLPKGSAAIARVRPSKLKSWFTKLRPQATPSHPPPPSRFNSLPLEIRRQIYAYILQSYGTVQHLFLINGKLTHVRCVSPASHACHQTDDARFRNECKPYDAADRNSVQAGWEIVPLLLTCRQTYLEFSEIIYLSNTFYLGISGAKRLVATVPASHLALADLHLQFSVWEPMYLPVCQWAVGDTVANCDPKRAEAEWESFWNAFSRFQVRVLLVEFYDTGERVPEQALFEPLRKVKAGKFELVVPWPKGLYTTGEFEDAAFAVRRPPESVGTGLMCERNVAKGGPGVGYPQSYGSGFRDLFRKR